MTADTAPRPVFVYDGDCAFCSSSARALRRFVDPARSYAIEPYQFLDLTAYGLTGEECAWEAKFVRADGSVHGGHRSVAEALRHGRAVCRPLGALMTLPVVDGLAARAYRWVADHRSRLPGGTPTCSITPAPG
jgi:predicted DCC family thiol-disulfide oxidoreductase YuxK